MLLDSGHVSVCPRLLLGNVSELLQASDLSSLHVLGVDRFVLNLLHAYKGAELVDQAVKVVCLVIDSLHEAVNMHVYFVQDA